MISVPDGPIADENNNPTPTFVHFVNALAKLEPANDPIPTTYPQIAAIGESLDTINAGVVEKNVIVKFFGSKTGVGNITHSLDRADVDFVQVNIGGSFLHHQFYEVDENTIFTDSTTDILAWKFD